MDFLYITRRVSAKGITKNFCVQNATCILGIQWKENKFAVKKQKFESVLVRLGRIEKFLWPVVIFLCKVNISKS